MKFVVQWDEEQKRFRVAVIDTTKDDETIAKGEWTLYKGIAKLTYNGKTYIAVSSYHDGPHIPAETVLEITPAVLH